MANFNGCFHIASYKPSVVIKVDGHGTLNNAWLFKDFIERMITEGYTNFIVDLSLCKGMDSTFMGVLATITDEGESSKPSKLSLILINATDVHTRLFNNLGLSNILNIQHNNMPFPKDIEMKVLKEERYDPRLRLRLIQEVHEFLSRLNPANAAKFKPFLEMLAQEKQEMEKAEEQS